ncbi:MAG: GNAT family N-acetyltransferase [Chloroflexota bacterium]
MLNNNETTFIRDLGNGLILRRSSPADAEKLFHFNSIMHGEDGPDERIGQWARDLLEKPHPTFGVNDFTIVEEKASGKIISSLNHISQTWTYDGIPFGVGRPELVGTLLEYRNQGLVRLQFEEIHRWSTERGELLQAITGIPYYYRLFGYEMCVDLDGSRSGFEMNLPKLKDETVGEPYKLRPALASDIPFLKEVYDYASKRSLLYAVRDDALWRLEISGRSEQNINRLVWNIIERSDNGEAVGFMAHPWFAWDITVPIQMFELKAGVSWLDVTPSVVRWMWDLGKTVCESEGKRRSAFTFALAGSHPVYEIMRDNLPRIRNPYTWYIRVPDLPAFIQRIRPVLESRLENSLMPGYSGELKLNFYRSGLRLLFDQGKLKIVDTWQPDSRNEGDLRFPNLTFFQLLFGHRTLDELNKSYADCFWQKDETRMLASTLFPRKASQFLGIV